MTSTQTAAKSRWDTRTLVTMALLAAIAAALSFIEFPFGVDFLKYDASNVPPLIGGLVFGAGPGIAISAVSCVIHALFTGNWLGCVMNVCALSAAVIPPALLYRRFGKISSAICGLVIGIALATAVMIGMNLLLDPPFYGYPLEAVKAMVLPILLPFNLMKTAINSVISVLVFRPIAKLARPRTGKAVLEPEVTPATERPERVEADGAGVEG